MRVEDLIRKGQAAELRERLEELRKRHQRLREDVTTYTFPADPLRPEDSCRLDLAAQAMDDLVRVQAELAQVRQAIRELEG